MVRPYDDEFDTGGPRRAMPRPGFAPNELSGQPSMPAVGGQTNAGGYTDPFTNLLTTTAMRRMNTLAQPQADPMLDEVLGLIRGRIGAVQSQPTGFSPVEQDRLMTRSWDGLEQRRTAAKQRATEDAARRGVGESSGVIQEQYRNIDQAFDSDRTASERDTNIWMSTEENNRRNQQSAQLAQLTGMLSGVQQQRESTSRANENDIMQIAQMLSQLGPQRLALAMSALNGGGGNDLNGLFNSSLALSNSGQNQQNYQNQGQAAMMAGLGQLLGSIMAGRGAAPQAG